MYDISKHPLTEDNLFLFARSLDGTHAFQHKFTTYAPRRPVFFLPPAKSVLGKKAKNKKQKEIFLSLLSSWKPPLGVYAE